MRLLANPPVAATLVGLYLLLYAGVIQLHRVELTDLPTFAATFVTETALLLLWCLAWSAASWLHARRDELLTHLSITALGGTVCLLLLYLALPWAFYLLGLPWRAAYYELARLLGALLFGLWQWRIVTGRRPPVRLWAVIAATSLGLQGLHIWSQINGHEALSRLPFEANVVLQLGAGLKGPGLDEGLQKLWAGGWD